MRYVLRPMSKLLDLVQSRLKAKGLTARAVSERTEISYPTVLAVINEGRVPRKAEHREALRKVFEVDTATWTAAMASSQKGGVDLPDSGPLNLQQLIVKQLMDLGLTEQSLAKRSGLGYPTLMGITRKGAVPRFETMKRLAEALDVPLIEVEKAAQVSRSGPAAPATTDVPKNSYFTPTPPVSAPTSEQRTLAELTVAAVERSGLSVAAFAEERGLPYLTLSRVVNQGDIPQDEEVRSRLAAAIGLDSDGLAAALNPSNASTASPDLGSTAPARVPATQTALERSGSHSNELASLCARMSNESRAALIAFLRTIVH